MFTENDLLSTKQTQPRMQFQLKYFIRYFYYCVCCVCACMRSKRLSISEVGLWVSQDDPPVAYQPSPRWICHHWLLAFEQCPVAPVQAVLHWIGMTTWQQAGSYRLLFIYYLLRLYSTSAEGLQDTRSYSLLKMLSQDFCMLCD